jgi:hypothetical protein
LIQEIETYGWYREQQEENCADEDMLHELQEI